MGDILYKLLQLSFCATVTELASSIYSLNVLIFSTRENLPAPNVKRFGGKIWDIFQTKKGQNEMYLFRSWISKRFLLVDPLAKTALHIVSTEQSIVHSGLSPS